MAHNPSFKEIINALQARPEDVACRYAPGGLKDSKGRYWTNNPARDNTHKSSFHVSTRGQYAGRWYDYVWAKSGDMLDLIEMVLACDRKDALEEAKRFLGMASETPEQRKIRLQQEQKAACQREVDAKADAARQEQRGRQAQGIFLNAQADLAGTPVAAYLAGRAIGLDRLGRTPGSLRFHPKLHYYHMDKKTGEVIEGDHPAMVAAIYSGWTEDGSRPEFIGVHKTYLQQNEAGGWIKLRVPKPKLLWGTKQGGYIRLWSGIGPRGGKGPSLSKARDGSRLYITEGIENGLSCVVLNPSDHVAAAIDLGNIQAMRLPPQITEVVIIADNDAKPELMQPIHRAIEAFQSQGRQVSLWGAGNDGSDLNDALMAARPSEEGAA